MKLYRNDASICMELPVNNIIFNVNWWRYQALSRSLGFLCLPASYSEMLKNKWLLDKLMDMDGANISVWRKNMAHVS